MSVTQVLFLGLWWFAAGWIVAWLLGRHFRRQKLLSKRLKASLYRYIAKQNAALNPKPLFRHIDEIQAEQDRQSIEGFLEGLGPREQSSWEADDDGA